ncbi:unnamed protein product [Protopolystoma xenopodis]|uniref:Uncharacterized protein n=1 Tax=Protopolystoma xenopodis TaxID=117903 RepID=A0A3S5BHN3_9PLAT|nr:unnamed protein product [Protopolystoma xenopodis]
MSSLLLASSVKRPPSNCANKPCCDEFSSEFPFSLNIFLPGTNNIVQEFVSLRHRLTTAELRVRLRMGLNTFESGCIYNKERVLRVESITVDDLIKAVDLLDAVFPAWNVWSSSKTDAELSQS